MSMIIGDKPNINTPLGWVLVVFAIILIAFSIGLMLGGIFVQNKLNQRFNNDLNKMMNDQQKQVQISEEQRAKSRERRAESEEQRAKSREHKAWPEPPFNCTLKIGQASCLTSEAGRLGYFRGYRGV